MLEEIKELKKDRENIIEKELNPKKVKTKLDLTKLKTKPVLSDIEKNIQKFNQMKEYNRFLNKNEEKFDSLPSSKLILDNIQKNINKKLELFSLSQSNCLENIEKFENIHGNL